MTEEATEGQGAEDTGATENQEAEKPAESDAAEQPEGDGDGDTVQAPEA